MRKYRVATKEGGAKHYWKHYSREAIQAYMEYYRALGYTDVTDISIRCLKRRTK